MNEISEEKLKALADAFERGESVRQAAKSAGVANRTAGHYRKDYLDAGFELPKCECGQEAGHRGWCRARFLKSPRRQAFLKQLHEKSRKKGTLWKIRSGDLNCWFETEETEHHKMVAEAIVKYQPNRLSDIYSIRKKGQPASESLFGSMKFVLSLLTLLAPEPQPAEPEVKIPAGYEIGPGPRKRGRPKMFNNGVPTEYKPRTKNKISKPAKVDHFPEVKKMVAEEPPAPKSRIAPTDNKDEIYNCVTCKIEFPSLSWLESHQESHHGVKFIRSN